MLGRGRSASAKLSRNPTANRHVGSVGVFILCVNLWRYSHLMRSSILTSWGHGQSKSLFLQPRHSHVMRKPTVVLSVMTKGRSFSCAVLANFLIVIPSG